MRMIQRLARGGASKRMAELWQQRVEKVIEIGGDFIYLAPDGPLDEANYDDPHKRVPRNPEVTKDLDEGHWTPL